MVTMKEPWQMTREEIAGLSETKAMKSQRGFEDWQIPRDLYAKGKWGSATSEARGRNHRISVERALSEGKPVPPEVLKDYPDLKAPEATPKAAGTIKNGDVITDGLVNGKVTGEGVIKAGKKGIPAYKVAIQAGHQKGDTSLIAKADAKPAAQPLQRVETTEDIEANLAEAQIFHKRRAELSQRSDEQRSHERTINPQKLTTKRLMAWKKRPGTADIRGIDSKTIGKMR